MEQDFAAKTQSPDLLDLGRLLLNRTDCIERIVPLTSFIPLAVMRLHRTVPVKFDEQSRHLTFVTDRERNDELINSLSRAVPDVSCGVCQVDAATIDGLLAIMLSLRDNADTDHDSSGGTQGVTQVEMNPQPEEQADPETSSPEPYEVMGQRQAQNPENDQGAVLFVCPARALALSLQSALEAERLAPVTVSTLSEARERLSERAFDAMYLHSSLRDDPAFDSFVQEHAWSTTTRVYEDEHSLLLGKTQDPALSSLNERHLRVARYRQQHRNASVPSHHSELAELAVEIAREAGVSTVVYPLVSAVAYLHDAAEDDLECSAGYSTTDIIRLSTALLKRWEYPAEIVDMMTVMSESGSVPVDTTNKNILTAACCLLMADNLSHKWPNYKWATGTELPKARKALQQLTESLGRNDILEALMRVARTKRGADNDDKRFCIHLLATDGSDFSRLSERFEGAGYELTISRSIRDCALAYRNLRPGALIVATSQAGESLNDLLFGLTLKGVRIDQTPTILLLPGSSLTASAWCLKHGIEDVLPIEIHADVLLAKADRIRDRVRHEVEYRLSMVSGLGTHGSLESMTLAGILDAVRGNNSPLHISLTGDGHSFTMYVESDKVLFAETDTVSGIKAVAEAIKWTSGIWSIDPISTEDVPETNINASICSVLLEACVQNDEAGKKQSDYEWESLSRD